MLKWLMLATLFLFFQFLHAQPITGTIKDSQTNLPIPYASIGLKKTNKGTNAEVDGRFTLNIPAAAIDDSLIISCVGYKTVKVPVTVVQNYYEIMMKRSEAVMQEVVIRERIQKITLQWNKGRTNTSHTTSGMNTQFAKLLKAPEPQSLLQSVTIVTSSGRKSRYRIRIYDYDSIKKRPGAELSDSVIEVYGKRSTTIDLQDYHIIIPHKQFFVAVQWLLIEENKEITKTTSGNTLITYHPSICMKTVNQGEGNTWVQLHNLEWLLVHYDASITATLLY